MLVTPSTRRGRTTVDNILVAACELFTRHGVRSTTLDGIGVAAGVGRGQLYHFFSGKGDIVAEVTARQVRCLLEEIEPVLTAMATAQDLWDFCAGLVDYHSRSQPIFRCPMGVLIHQLTEDDGDARAVLQHGFQRWQELLVDGLTHIAAADGLAVNADPSVAATALLAAYQGGLLLAEVHGDVVHLELALHAAAVLAVGPVGQSGIT